MINNYIYLHLGVIVFKLWKSQIELQKYGVATNSSLTHRITRILVESAALYSMNHLLYVILYEVKNQVEITTGYLVSLKEQLYVFHNLNVRTGSQCGNYHLQLDNHPI